MFAYVGNASNNTDRELSMSDRGISLRSLSPGFQPQDHDAYVRILVSELSRPGSRVARNIALTGHYGSGKSSVLVEVERRLEAAGTQVVNLSLPSLGIGDGRLETPTDQTTLDTTNLIQKEIVKQLLYRRKPADAPASRYNRLDIFQRRPAYRRAAGAAAAITTLALIAGLPDEVAAAFPNAFWKWIEQHSWHWVPIALQWLSLPGTFALAIGAVVWAQRTFHQRVRLTELAAGPAKIALSENSTSYFDEYLDEIVYFFQNSGTTVVVFEDLDRFEEPHIIETLRELNLLLNNAEQTGADPIRFVYAIRDSIFEKFDEDQVDAGAKGADGASDPTASTVDAETRRLMSTNRTKFFDLVVPMVPFISHRTSRELIRAELSSVEEAQRPSPAVIDLVSARLTDMRLIKNICNEYDIFRLRILGGNGLNGLTPDRLFASIVYKNLYMGDYERIRDAESRFDLLYAAYRDWVGQRSSAAREVERAAQAQLARTSPAAINARSRRLGERLQFVLNARWDRQVDPAQALVLMGGTQFKWAQLQDADFWRAYLEEQGALGVIYRRPYGVEGGNLSFKSVQTLMNERLSQADWEAEHRTEQRKRMVAAVEEQRTLAHASLADALAATKHRFVHDGEEKALDDVALGLFDDEADVVLELLAAGYIDENFALYVTQYPGQGSATAMNFVLKAVQPNDRDIEYHFDSVGDIDSVVQAEGSRLLQGRSVYNIEVFDRLFETDPASLREPIRRLARTAHEDTEFIDAYLARGKRATEFVERLSFDWPGVFAYLLDDEVATDSVDLLNAAVRGVDPMEGYELAAGQRETLVATLPRLSVITTPQDSKRSEAIARVLKDLGLRAADLSRVAEPLRSEMVSRGIYEVTYKNLLTIVGSNEALSLDSIATDHDEVYAHLLDSMPEYLTAVASVDSIPTVVDPAKFNEVLANVADHAPDLLTQIASTAADGCVLDDLTVLSSDLWPAIARAHRLRRTVPLLAQYIDELGFDHELVDDLAAARTVEIEEDEPGRLELGVRFLNSKALDDDTKIDLLASLKLTRESITASSLAAHAHPLIPPLVKGGWIADDADAYTVLAEDDRRTKAALAAASKAFPRYMASLALSANDLRDLASPPTPDPIKEVLLSDYHLFESSFGANGATELAKWAAAKDRQVEPEVLVSLAAKGTSRAAAPIVHLLAAQLSDLSLDVVVRALNGLGDPYEQVTNRGRERPRVPNLAGMANVLARLQSEGIVSKYHENAKKARFEITKRYS
jgi:hypothetical protein